MKKKLLLMSILLLLCFCFSSCEKTPKDVLEGTWEYVPDYYVSVSAQEIQKITLIFDGKGKYTSKVIDYEERIINGTYVIKDNNYVLTYYSKQLQDGTTKEYSDLYELDLNSTPHTLTYQVYDASGNFLMTFLFKKQ